MPKIKLELMDWMKILNETKEQIRQLMVALELNNLILAKAEREVAKFEVKNNAEATVAS